MQPLVPDDPSHIGPYRLIARLGAGGMGRVYLCRGEDGRTVAVKLVRTEVAEQEEFRRRFTREVAAARRVSGEWTAGVLDADTEAELPWVATEYVPGPTLRAVVRGDFGPLPSASAHVLAHRLAQALQAVHRAGLVHRDLKPSNILLTVDGPRVIDFGIARALDASSDSTLTPAGSLLGTPEFMSPEQVRGERLTPASDVFALGSALVYAATGRSPFQGEGTGAAHALMFRIAYEDPDLSGVPEAIADLIRECLAKDPADRPTVGDIAERTRRAPAGAWLPAALLARLDRAAAQPLPEAPRRTEAEAETGAPGLAGFPDFPEPVEPDRRRDVLDVPEVGIAPPRVRQAATESGSRAGRWAGVALGMAAVAMAGWLVTLAVTGVSWSALAGGDAEPGLEVPEPSPLVGAWRFTLGEEGPPLLSVRLDLVKGADLGERGARVVSATRDATCTGWANVVSRTTNTLALGFNMSRTGAVDRPSECGLPDVMRLVAPRDDVILWERSDNVSVVLDPASELSVPVPAGLRGDWYAAERGLLLTVFSGRAGSVVVSGVEDRGGRHCEWEAALLDTGTNRIATTGGHVVEGPSDPGCTSSTVTYDYELRGSDDSPVLVRSSTQETTTLRLRHRP
ncbi:serine/threonine-protein kinase [Streptomyces sp. S3(2020)]|uniref:serine/threonine-protein kinase n=1 Tax=Streptomyces sp. S3(2020) TaxID=2732044 RepID=UPI0019CFA364|nr:serine/threonine-protein kinase [Streptomyces sp. S3(2020)]